jgi:pre-mRNA-splicing factor ISY1
MARNEEKALTSINRWLGQKRDLERATNPGQKATYVGGALPDPAQAGPYAERKRPKFATEVTSVRECEVWRGELVRGISKKIAEIQNAALGEHRLRDLNDEINKDLREKGHWEDHIKSLGGPDYKAQKAGAEAVYGAELASHSGYKYFGAAKDLPGVRELFETEEVPEAPRKTRKQLFKGITPDYYGWRDEEDGMLVLAEQQAEMEAVQKEVARWKAEQAKKPKKDQAPEPEPERPAKVTKIQKEDAKDQDSGGTGAKTADFKAYVDVPTLQEIEKLIIQKKKDALLKRYASADLKQKSTESSELVSGAT